MKHDPGKGAQSSPWVWLSPYAAWCCLFLGAAIGSVENAGVSRRLAVASGTLILVAFILLGAEVALAAARRDLPRLFWAGYAGIVVALGIVMASLLLPSTSASPSHLQESLRAVFERRGASSSYWFRGVQMRSRANIVGWMDSDTEKGPAPIVFIGDSFLESRSSTNLAARVESRLKSLGVGTGVVNLSKDDTEPALEYRNRFYEFALRKKPSRIVVFLYAGNDYHYGYSYARYEHPRVFVTPRALSRAIRVSPRAVRFLVNRYLNERPIVSRQDVADAMPGASEEVADRIYLAALAYGTEAPGGEPLSGRPRRLMQRTGELVARALGVEPAAPREVASHRKVTAAQAPATAATAATATTPAPPPTPRPASPVCRETNWSLLWPDYQELFARPVESRLEAIGAFVAERYCGFTDVQPFVDLLSRQSREFRDHVTWGADMPYALFPAMAAAVSGQRRGSWIDRAEAGRLGREYARLMVELGDAARLQGSLFTVVLIPEASMVDDGFRRFWSGMPQFWDQIRGTHWVQEALARELKGRIDIIDLAKHRDLFQDAYWPLDGHFNEKGQAAVAELLARRFADDPWGRTLAGSRPTPQNE